MSYLYVGPANLIINFNNQTRERFICTIFVWLIKKIKMKIIPYILALCLFLTAGKADALAQNKLENGLELDKTAHNFGDVINGSGPLTCIFTMTNTSEKPAVIYNVVTSCGCTDVKWTREPIRPGQKGTISVTYSNDEGPYPFDKSITAYISDIKKPVILKVRGIAVEKKKPLAELYPVHYGPLGIREALNKCGNLEQGGVKSETAIVANLSDSPLEVSFKDISPNLSLDVKPNPIPAGSTAEISFSISADRSIWGKNTYWATPVLNGKTYSNNEGEERIGFWAFTKENFSRLSDEQKSSGPMPKFKESTFSFGKIRRGTEVHAEFTFKNEGKRDLCVYRVNSDACRWSHSTIPVAAPGEEVTFRVHLDTSKMPTGEALAIVTLTTNSPLRPIVNLFIAGWLE